MRPKTLKFLNKKAEMLQQQGPVNGKKHPVDMFLRS